MKAVLSVITLPGVIIAVLPFSLEFIFYEPGTIYFGALISYGIAWMLIIYCTSLFARKGRGTITPWSPPTKLVVSGPFMLTRNPIFLAMIIGNISLAIFFNSLILIIYSLVATIIFHIRVVFHEEPFLAKEHGEQWYKYCQLTTRWFLFF